MAATEDPVVASAEQEVVSAPATEEAPVEENKAEEPAEKTKKAKETKPKKAAGPKRTRNPPTNPPYFDVRKIFVLNFC